MKYFEVIKTVKLFDGIEADSLESALGCLGARTAGYGKGETLIAAGSKPSDVGIVLTGQLHIVKDGYDGGRALLATLVPGDIFAEALCCAGIAESPVTVISQCESTVMLIKFARILSNCPKVCAFHTKLTENMLRLIARKNLYLQSRMEITNLKTVRAKVLAYLESFTERQGKKITIPHNREEMAEYLCADRSALSHELMKMKADGLIDYRKNKFELL